MSWGLRNEKWLCLLQFIRSPWKQVLESSNSRGASFNLSCCCSSTTIFDRFGNLLTWSTDNFPWGGCTVVGQVSKLHLRGSPALIAKAMPIVMIFQTDMEHSVLSQSTFLKFLFLSCHLGRSGLISKAIVSFSSYFDPFYGQKVPKMAINAVFWP